MKQIKMLSLFVEISKKYIPAIDVVDLEYVFRNHQIDFDNSGPVCSDSELMVIFSESLENKVDQNTLYGLIEKICLEYCQTVMP